MITSGVPIRRFDDDELGRGRFARNLAKALTDYRFNDSLCVALYGAWGTGKSSLLNLTILALEELLPAARPTVIRFNPWNYADQSSLTEQFFSVLAKALEVPDDSAETRKISHLVKSIGDKFKPIGAIPHIGFVAKAVSGSADIIAKGLDATADEQADLETLKNSLSAELIGAGRRVIVIIDDIDRLTSDEIRLVFQLVKSVADFSNVIYLLAFDKAVAVKALERVQSGDGASYLEKIINVPLELPLISPAQLQGIFRDRVHNFAIHNRVEGWPDQHALEIVAALDSEFRTLRQLDRLVNVLSFSESLIEGEVDYADFIAITAIQILAPGAFEFIRDNPTLFVETPLVRLFHKAEDDSRDKNLLDGFFVDKRGAISEAALRQITYELFPYTGRLYQNSYYADAEHSKWVTARRICGSLELFQTYFLLDVPAEGFSARRMRSILDLLPDGNFSGALQGLIEDNSLLRFLEELKHYVTAVDERNGIPAVIAALFDLPAQLQNDLREFPVKMDGPTLVLQLVYHLTKRLKTEPERFACLQSAVEGANRALFPLVQTISVEDQTHGRFKLGGRADASKQLVSEDHLSELEIAARTKIEEWARDGRLADDAHLGYILYRWSNWGGGDRLKNYFLNELPTQQFAAQIVLQASREGVARFEGPRLSRDFIEPLAPLDEVRARIEQILEAHELPDDTAQTLRTMLDTPEPTMAGETLDNPVTHNVFDERTATVEAGDTTPLDVTQETKQPDSPDEDAASPA